MAKPARKPSKDPIRDMATMKANSSLPSVFQPERFIMRESGKLELRRGRPTLLTFEIATEILLNVSRCGKVIISCQAAGISKECLDAWRRHASEGKEPFVTFFDGTEAARAAWAMARVERIQNAPEWGASAWLLKHAGQEDWTPIPTKVVGNLNHTHELSQPKPLDHPDVLAAERFVLAETGDSYGEEGTNGNQG